MRELVVAVVFAVLSWWGSTGLILYLDGRPRSTFRRALGGASLLALMALGSLVTTRDLASPLGAYLAFASALVLWGWHELSLLLGAVTGPVRHACPPGLQGWDRFKMATLTLWHHELALFATLLLVLALGLGSANPVGAATFAVLWVMRVSAKLNVFLGVRNLSQEFIPEQLDYLKSYFGRASTNLLMPFSLLGGLAATVWAASGLQSQAAGSFEAVGLGLVTTILALGLLEHLFLAVPLPDAALWRWALRSRATRGKTAS